MLHSLTNSLTPLTNIKSSRNENSPLIKNDEAGSCQLLREWGELLKGRTQLFPNWTDLNAVHDSPLTPVDAAGDD